MQLHAGVHGAWQAKYGSRAISHIIQLDAFFEDSL
jgi:hypothetical protein